MERKTLERFKEIIRVLGSYGFGYIIDKKINNKKQLARNLRKAFEELGPTFIKIGQILSTRPDLISKEYIDELSKLQDSAPKENFEDIKNIFFEEFEKNISDVFKDFDEEPIASASISQVHQGILKDNRTVVIKIQRPKIQEKINLDLSILFRIAKMTKTKFEYSLINPIDALNEIKIATNKELDFIEEKNNIIEFKHNNKGVACVYVPEVIDDICTRKILVMEKINGIKIIDKQVLIANGYSLNDIAEKLCLSYCKQIFDDGFFHGDPHPGNLFIFHSKICYIDFGLMGRISHTMKEYLNKLLIALGTKNTDGVIDFLLGVGIKKGKINKNVLYEDVQYMIDIYLPGSLKNIKISELLQELVKLAQNNNIKLPRELTSLIRSMLILEGVVTYIDPELEILDVIKPFIKNKKLFFSSVNKNELFIELYNFNKSALKLPSKIDDLSDTISKGRLKLNIGINDIKTSMNQLNKMANRMVFGIVVAGMIVGSSLVLNAGVGPNYKGVSIIGITGYLVSAIFGMWLLISIIRSGSLK